MKERKRNKTRDRQSEVNCKKATSLIQDYAAGSLKPGIASDLEKHLSICPDCVAFLSTYEKAIDLVNSFFDKRSQRLKEGTMKSLRAKINRGKT